MINSSPNRARVKKGNFEGTRTHTHKHTYKHTYKHTNKPTNNNNINDGMQGSCKMRVGFQKVKALPEARPTDRSGFNGWFRCSAGGPSMSE